MEGLQGSILNYTHIKRKDPWRSLSQATSLLIVSLLQFIYLVMLFKNELLWQ